MGTHFFSGVFFLSNCLSLITDSKPARSTTMNNYRFAQSTRSKNNIGPVKRPVFQTVRGRNRQSYETLFTDVCKLRFNFLVTRFLATLTTLIFILSWASRKVKLSSVLFLGGGNDNYYYSKGISILTTPIDWFLIYVSLIIICITRKNYLHVSFDVRKNKWKRVFRKTVVYYIIYFLSYILVSFGLSQLNVVGNSQFFSFYFRMLSLFVIPMIYTIQHVYMDLDRLMFNHGARDKRPQTYITSKLSNSLQRSMILSLFNTFAILVVHYVCLWHFVRFFSKKNEHNVQINISVYGGQNSTHHVSLLPGFYKFFQYTMANFAVFQLWDTCNISFSAYLSAGPLHKDRLISMLSENPMETLISGLKSKDSFTKLTAFQELSYRSRVQTIANTKLGKSKTKSIYRTPIYENVKYWTLILQECFKALDSTNEKVSEYTTKITYGNDQEFLERTKIMRQQQEQREQLKLQEHDILFGTKGNENMYSHYTENFDQNDQWGPPFAIPVANDRVNDIFVKSSEQDDNERKYFYAKHDPSENNLISKVIIPYVCRTFDRFLQTFFFPDSITSNGEISEGRLAFLFGKDSSAKLKKHFDYQKQAEMLCPLPSVYAEAVLSIMGILINSLDEAPRSACVGSIADVLKILENSITCLGWFIESQHSDKLPDGSEELSSTTSMNVLYSLSLNAFLELVAKYNDLLNDIYLEDNVRELVKWVSERINQ